MNSVQACFIIGLLLGLSVGGLGVYKWDEASNLEQLSKQISADNKALEDMEKRATLAEHQLSDTNGKFETLNAERAKERAKNPSKCKLDADTARWLQSVTSTKANLPR